MTWRLYLIGALIAIIFQTGALAKMIVDRNRLLTRGTEVILETGFIDPRDLFRGHYVILNLAISRLDQTRVAPPDPAPGYGDPVWVELAPGDTGFWDAVAIHTTPPATGTVIQGEWSGQSGTSLRIAFPVDRFFAPRKRAQELENIRRDRQLGVILALAADGQAAIKGITAEGDRIYVEPLF